MLFIAHRCNDNHSYKENSLEAIKYCLEQNYIDGIEIDLSITKDNKLILYHDYFYKGKFIKNISFKAFKQVNTFSQIKKILPKDKLILIDIKSFHNEEEIVKQIKKEIPNQNNIYLCSMNSKILNKLKKYRRGLIVPFFNNDNFDITLATYYNYQKFPINNTFIWTINELEKLKKIKGNYNIISDKCYVLTKV